MEYELRSIENRDSFRRINETTGAQLIGITIGIKGDIYGFTRYNELTVELLTSLSIDAAGETIQAAALDFITKNYPNI